VIAEQTLSATEAIVKYVWLHGSITLREAVDLLKFDKARISRLLREQLMYGTLIAKGPARARRYLLPPEVSTPEEMLPPEPPLDTFWVTPGWLLVGNALNTRPDALSEQVRYLTGKGVTRILYLLNYDYGQSKQFSEAFQASGASIRLQFTRLHPRRRFLGMEEVLFAIDSALKQGEVVYLSAPDIEQAAAIAACCLIRQGATGPQALAQVTQMRQSGFEPWHTYPRTRLWRQFVLRWARSYRRNILSGSTEPTEQ